MKIPFAVMRKSEIWEAELVNTLAIFNSMKEVLEIYESRHESNIIVSIFKKKKQPWDIVSTMKSFFACNEHFWFKQNKTMSIAQ